MQLKASMKSLNHARQPTDDLGEVMQQMPTVELSNIMSYSLNTKYALSTCQTGAWARPTRTRNKPSVTVVLAR